MVYANEIFSGFLRDVLAGETWLLNLGEKEMPHTAPTVIRLVQQWANIPTTHPTCQPAERLELPVTETVKMVSQSLILYYEESSEETIRLHARSNFIKLILKISEGFTENASKLSNCLATEMNYRLVN